MCVRSGNIRQFHAKDGKGYAFMADMVMQTDAVRKVKLCAAICAHDDLSLIIPAKSITSGQIRPSLQHVEVRMRAIRLTFC
jgi:hypothetical protein